MVAANPHSLPGKCDVKGVNVVIIWWKNRKWLQIGNVRLEKKNPYTLEGEEKWRE